MIVFMMGVSGSGKSTIGPHLAERLGIEFADGDDYHPQANKDKMAAGHPLNDDDRRPWLHALNQLARERDDAHLGIVIACSALKQAYREWLTEGLPAHHAVFVLLDGSRELLADRLGKRKNHFMNPNLLDSQLQTLELPADAVRVVNDGPVDAVTDSILAQLPSTGR